MRQYLITILLISATCCISGHGLERLRQTPSEYDDGGDELRRRRLFLRYPRSGGDTNDVCDAVVCPCCDVEKWPEFVRAVQQFSSSRQRQRGCYERQDEDSDIVALISCAGTGEEQEREVAYMSFDYAEARGEPRYCGSSDSDIEPVRNERRAQACGRFLRDLAERYDVECGDDFGCT